MKKTRFISYLLALSLLGTNVLFAGSGNMVGGGAAGGGDVIVDDDHILWGTGPNQVSLDDVPNGITVKLGQDASVTGTPTFNSINLTIGLGIASGGTGATTAAGARTNLGLGTIATQNASGVAITGGSITGITDLAIADGGTNASTAAGARANLGAAELGANSDITSLLGLTGVIQAPTSILDSSGNEILNFISQASAINELNILNAAAGNNPQILASGGDSDVSITLMPKDNGKVVISNGAARTSALLIGKDGSGNRTSYLSLIGDDTNDAAGEGLKVVRDGGVNGAGYLTNIGDGDLTIETLGLGSLFLGTNGSAALTIDSTGQVEITDALISGGSITGITPLDINYGGTNASTASDARTNLGLGTIATQDASSVTITGGSISGIAALAVADGGTGATNAGTARLNLGAATTYQNQTIKMSAKVWTGQATTTSGVASFFPTDDNTSGGTALFTNIYSVQLTAEGNVATAVSVPLASLKLIAANKKTITANVINGLNIVAVGDTVAFAPDGTNVHLTITGD